MADPLHHALDFGWRAPEAMPAALGGLFGGGAKAPALPPPQPVTPIPDLNDPAMLAAKQRQLQAAAGNSGRLSTILTASSGNDYTGTKLGSQ